MSTGAVHNPTPFTQTDSDVCLAPAPCHSLPGSGINKN
jgi:hypothetical protein